MCLFEQPDCETEGTYPNSEREERYTLKTYLTPISSSLMFPHLLRHWSFAFSTYELPNPRDKYVKGWRAPQSLQDPQLSRGVCLPHPSTRVILSWFRGPQRHTYSSLFLQNISKAHSCLWWYYRLRPVWGAPQESWTRPNSEAVTSKKIKPQCDCKEKLRVESVSCIKWERQARI